MLATIVVRSANWVYDTVVIDLLRFVLGLVTDSWMAGCLVAKAKVAGSNPVFRSNLKAPVLQRNLREAGAFVFL